MLWEHQIRMRGAPGIRTFLTMSTEYGFEADAPQRPDQRHGTKWYAPNCSPDLCVLLPRDLFLPHGLTANEIHDLIACIASLRIPRPRFHQLLKICCLQPV